MRDWYVEIVVECVNMEKSARATGTLRFKRDIYQWEALLNTGFVEIKPKIESVGLTLQIKKAILGVVGQVNLPLTRTTTVSEE